MTDMKLMERLKYSLPALIFLGLMIAAVFEFKWFQNTLEAKKMAGIFALIGAVLGGAWGHYFAKSTKDSTDKLRLYCLFIILSVLLMPVFGSITNRLLSFNDFKNEQVEFYEQRGFIAGMGVIKGQSLNADGYFTFVVIDGELQRFKSEKILYPKAKKGDRVDLKMKKGLYGFWVVDME